MFHWNYISLSAKDISIWAMINCSLVLVLCVSEVKMHQKLFRVFSLEIHQKVVGNSSSPLQSISTFELLHIRAVQRSSIAVKLIINNKMQNQGKLIPHLSFEREKREGTIAGKGGAVSTFSAEIFRLKVIPGEDS